MSTQQSSVTDLGAALVTALAARDFARLADTLTPGVRMRALIPPGPVEVSGAEAAAAKFSAWFGDAEQLELVRSGSDTVADRLLVF
jgi:ketosteroid isomerase-like protein